MFDRHVLYLKKTLPLHMGLQKRLWLIEKKIGLFFQLQKVSINTWFIAQNHKAKKRSLKRFLQAPPFGHTPKSSTPIVHTMGV
jgi:hypothetical protein